jgi:hypothetical protein
MTMTGTSTAKAGEIFIPQSVPDELLFQEQRPGFRVGPLDMYPRVVVGGIYDDNIFLNDYYKQSDYIWQAAPGLALTLGEPTDPDNPTLNLDYSPTFVFFMDHSEYDMVQHNGRIGGRFPWSKLTLSFNQDYTKSQTAIAGRARLFTVQAFNTLLAAHYDVGEKTSFDINGRQSIYDYESEGLIDTREWVNDNWFNYRVLSKVSTGVGFSIGYIDVDRYPGQWYQRLSARAVYELTGKVDLNLSGGGERREFGGGEPDRYTPVFSVGGVYRPTAVTSLTLDAYRREQPSAYLASYNYINTGFNVGVRHVIFDRLALSVNGGYENLEYLVTSSAYQGNDRQDDYFFVRPGVDYSFTTHWRAGAYYQFRQNISNQTFYEYSANQVGFQVFWLF